MKGWSKPLLSFQDTGDYACTAVCPCVVMGNVGRMLTDMEGHSDTCTAATAGISLIVDIPCVFFLKSSRDRIQETYYSDGTQKHEESDEWDPSQSSYDWWPFDWCKFYTCAALENCCSQVCIGPNVKSGSFPMAFTCMAASIYPLCVCPLSFLLRRFTMDRLNIDSESLITTCTVSACCTPCSLVQMREELQSSSNFDNAHHHSINSMY